MWFLVIWLLAISIRLIVVHIQDHLVHREFLADRPKTHNSKPLSIVVIFRSIQGPTHEWIRKIINQDYEGALTLWLVQDGVSDGYPSGIEDWCARDSRIKYFQHNKYTVGKKGALAEVMQVVETEWVLFTDIDCEPRSDRWISVMMRETSAEHDLVLGLSPFKTESPEWVHYDTLFIFLSYISWAILGRPYMSVGRNVLLRKSWWQKSGGVSTHLDKAGGDDDLTIQKSPYRPRTRWSISLPGHAISQSPKNFNTYLQSKARHLSAGMSYSVLDRFCLAALSILHAGVIIGMIGLLWFYPILISVISAIYFAAMHQVINKWMKALGIQWTIWPTVRSDIITPLVYAYIVVQALGRNEKTW